jgi:hypothetical protein
MKDPKILPFGSWFKVYEQAGRNFKKSQQILESRSYRGLQRIFESADSIQSSLATNMDSVAKAAFAGLSAMEKQPSVFSQKNFRNGSSAANNAIANNIKTTLDNIQLVNDNPDGYSRFDSISATVQKVTYMNAMGAKFQNNTSGDIDISSEYGVGNKEALQKTTDIYEFLYHISLDNLNEFFDNCRYASTNGVPDVASWEKKMWGTDKFAMNGNINHIHSIQSGITMSATDTLPTAWTKPEGGTFEPSPVLDNETGEILVQATVYTVEQIVPQGGDTALAGDIVKSVVVNTETNVTNHEAKLDNANEVFVVGKTSYVNPTDGPNKLKAGIQTLLNQFSSVAKIQVLGGASKEGPATLNKQLVDGRAKVVADLIKATWPNLAATTTAIQGDYSKIQPANAAAIDPDYRTIFLFIDGKKTDTVTKESPAADLGISEFKKDAIIINEYVLTARFDATAGSSWIEYAEKTGKEAAAAAKKAKKKSDKEAGKWADVKVGSSIKAEITLKDGKTEVRTKKITRVAGEGENKVAYYQTSDGTEKAIKMNQFKGFTLLSAAKNVATDAANKVEDATAALVGAQSPNDSDE